MNLFKNMPLDSSKYGELVKDDTLSVNIKIAVSREDGDSDVGCMIAIINDRYCFPLHPTAVAMPGFDIGIPLAFMYEMGILITPTSTIAELDGERVGFTKAHMERGVAPFQYDTYLHELLMRVVCDENTKRHKPISMAVCEIEQEFDNPMPFELAYEYQVTGNFHDLTTEAACGIVFAMGGKDSAPPKRAVTSAIELFNFLETGGSNGHTLN